MTEALILSACRTPIGRFQGALSSLSAPELGALALRAAVEKARVSPGDVEEVILGNVLSAGVGQAPARQAALKGGLPPEVAALTINKVCGSGLKAVMLAAQAIRSGDASVVAAGGMESMSRAGWHLPREGSAIGHRTLHDVMLHDGLTCAFSHHSMGEYAENLAERAGISREDQDQFAAESHARAIKAVQAGEFAEELFPVAVHQRGQVTSVTQDEGPRSDSSLDRLAGLKPAFRTGGSVTAGNSSMISDGAAAVVVASDAAVQRHGWRPLARIVASATTGGPPEELFTAPVEAIRQVVRRGGVPLNDVGLIELNEAFAVQMLACLRGLDLSTSRVNVNGGAIALGHPIGASGARVLTTLVHALHRRHVRYGIAALCLGGGNAVAMLVERM